MKRMDQRTVNGDGVDETEAEVSRARLSFEQGLQEASRAGSRAARRVVTPALIGAGLVGGALLVIALIRLARKPPKGPLIRIVVQSPAAPASPRRLLPIIGGSVARWVIERQLSGGGPLRALATAVLDQHVVRSQEARHAASRAMPSENLGRVEN